MCDPVTIGLTAGIVGGAAALTGSVVSAYGQYQSGKFNEKVLKNRAKQAEWGASQARQQGREVASEIRAQGRAVASTATAQVGAGNIDPTSGSAAGAIAASHFHAETDAETARANALRKAWGLESEAQDARTQAEQARKAGILGSISALVGG